MSLLNPEYAYLEPTGPDAADTVDTGEQPVALLQRLGGQQWVVIGSVARAAAEELIQVADDLRTERRRYFDELERVTSELKQYRRAGFVRASVGRERHARWVPMSTECDGLGVWREVFTR